MKRVDRAIGLFLLVLYAFFFASTTLFVHTHQDSNITHSHPWSSKNHTHTGSQLQLIDCLADGLTLVEDTVLIPDVKLLFVCSINTCPEEVDVLNPGLSLCGLRAPPVFAA